MKRTEVPHLHNRMRAFTSQTPEKTSLHTLAPPHQPSIPHRNDPTSPPHSTPHPHSAPSATPPTSTAPPAQDTLPSAASGAPSGEPSDNTQRTHKIAAAKAATSATATGNAALEACTKPEPLAHEAAKAVELQGKGEAEKGKKKVSKRRRRALRKKAHRGGWG